LLAEYDTHVAEVRAAIGEDVIAQTEVSAFRPYGDGSAFLIWINSFADSILSDLGLHRPQAQWDTLPDGAERIDNLSLEMIPLLDADVIFTVAPWNDDTNSFFNELESNPIWQQLRAVQAGQLFLVNAPWNEGSVIAANLVLDDILNSLAPDARTTTSK
jgi:iron complex transport system substrate-binding protein